MSITYLFHDSFTIFLIFILNFLHVSNSIDYHFITNAESLLCVCVLGKSFKTIWGNDNGG